LIVGRTRRRTGIGRRLLQAAVRAASTSRVFTSTNRSNAAMPCSIATAGASVASYAVSTKAIPRSCTSSTDRLADRRGVDVARLCGGGLASVDVSYIGS
jgi:hypothetical protein